MFKLTKSLNRCTGVCVDELVDVISLVAPVTHKQLDNVIGLFHNDRLFAVVEKDNLYLRTDAITRRDFECLGVDKPVSLPVPCSCDYYPVPNSVIENRVRLQVWARNAMRIASLEIIASHSKSA